MKIKDLASVLYSTTGNIQWAVLWDSTDCKDVVDDCSVDYIVKNYGESEITHIEAEGGKLVITTPRAWRSI